MVLKSDKFDDVLIIYEETLHIFKGKLNQDLDAPGPGWLAANWKTVCFWYALLAIIGHYFAPEQYEADYSV